MLDVVHRRREDPPVLVGDPPFHFFRVESGELPGDRDDRDVDVREDVRRGAKDYHRARDEDQEGEDDEGIGTVER